MNVNTLTRYSAVDGTLEPRENGEFVQFNDVLAFLDGSLDAGKDVTEVKAPVVAHELGSAEGAE